MDDKFFSLLKLLLLSVKFKLLFLLLGFEYTFLKLLLKLLTSCIFE